MSEEKVARAGDEGDVEEFTKKGYVDNVDTVYQPDSPPPSVDPTTGMGIYSEKPKAKVYKITKCKGEPKKKKVLVEEKKNPDGSITPIYEEREVGTVFCNGKRVLGASYDFTSPKCEFYDREFDLEDNGFIKMKLDPKGKFKVKYVDIYEDGSIKDAGTSSSAGGSSSSGDTGPKVTKKNQLVIDKSGMSTMLGSYQFSDKKTGEDTIENITVKKASQTVFAEGCPLARKGDEISGGTIKEGSSNVYAG